MIRAKKIAPGFRTDPQRALSELRESLDLGREGQPGGVRPEEFSIRDLLEECYFDASGNNLGREFVGSICSRYGQPMTLQEADAMAGVATSMFAGIIGQLFITRVLQGYNQEEFVASRVVPVVPTKLNGEKWPGLSYPKHPGTDQFAVEENELIPHIGFNEEYINTPSTKKHAAIIPVTREAVFFDRTGILLKRAQEVGWLIGLDKELRLLDVMIGAVNNFQEKRSTDSSAVSLKTFYSAVDAGRWINHQDGNGFVDFSSIDVDEQLFANMLDPNTGQPILMGGRFLFLPQTKAMRAQQILTATQLWKMTAGGLSTTGGIGTAGPNLLANMNLRVETSRQLYRRLQTGLGVDGPTASDYWFYGDPERAFAYMENWPITLAQAPQNSEAEFNQDVVVRFKASERGAAAIIEPRAWIRNRALTTSSSSGA